MNERIEKEMQLLCRHYPQAEWHEHGATGWVRIPDFLIPPGIWGREKTTVCFEVLGTYPGVAPYGFYVEGGLRLKDGEDKKPERYTEPSQTPFQGVWGKFSWQIEGPWRPTEDLVSGSNLTNFVRTFRDRLTENI